MLRKFWCWLGGFECKWKTERELTYTRGAYGLFVGVQPPQVRVIARYQICEKCGKTQCVEHTLGPG